MTHTELADADRRPLAVGAPLIVVGTFAAGYAYAIGWPAWPVVDAGARIAYAALATGALAIGASLVREPAARFAINLVATLACVVPTMLPMVRPADWGYGGLIGWSLAVSVSVAIVASLAQRLRERDATPLVPLVMLGIALATGGLLMSTGSLKLGQAGLALAAGVAAALAACLIATPLGRHAGATHGVVTATGAIAAGLLVSGHLWSDLPIYAAACVGVAPLLAWASRVPLVARRPRWQRVAIGLLVAAIPASIAVRVEARKAYVESQAQGADDYGY